MKPILGYIMVIEKVVESDDLTYRVYGSFIASRYVEDRTGQDLTLRNVGMGHFFNAAYHVSMHRKEPLFTRHAPPPDSKVKAGRPMRGRTGSRSAIRRVGRAPCISIARN